MAQMARMRRSAAARPAEARNPVPPVRGIAAHLQTVNAAQGRYEREGRGAESES